MENNRYSMENLRMVSGFCSLLQDLALPKDVDELLEKLYIACSEHLCYANLTGKLPDYPS